MSFCATEDESLRVRVRSRSLGDDLNWGKALDRRRRNANERNVDSRHTYIRDNESRLIENAIFVAEISASAIVYQSRVDSEVFARQPQFA